MDLYLQIEPLVQPSDIFVRELRSNSEWDMLPPADIINSFHREYLEPMYYIQLNMDQWQSFKYLIQILFITYRNNLV